MRRKLIIISILAVILSTMAGIVSPTVEKWWAEQGVTPGQKVVKRLSEYYQADLFDRVLAQASEEVNKVENAEYRPQILYIEWAALRRVETGGAGSDRQWTTATRKSDDAKAEFLQVYPDHLLAADMYFSDAMMLLAKAEYDEAAERLRTIEEKWPDARLTKKAMEIREKVESRKQKRIGND